MFKNLRATTGFGLAALSLVLGASPANAGFASFSIPVGAVIMQGGAVSATTPILPDSGTPKFVFNFVLPVDYQVNGEVRVILHLQSPAAPCTARIQPFQLSRNRPNTPLGNSLAGVNGGSANVAIAANAIKAKVITLGAPGIAPFTDQKPGDGFNLYIQRDADNAGDTCAGSVFLHAVYVRYQTP